MAEVSRRAGTEKKDSYFGSPVRVALRGLATTRVVVLLGMALGVVGMMAIELGAQQPAAPGTAPASNSAAPASQFLTPPARTDSPASQASSAPLPESTPAKVLRYAQRLIRRYDTNGDGRLDPAEWGRMQGNPASADADSDRLITLDELTEYVADYGRRRRIRLISPLVDEAKDYPSLLHPATAAQQDQAPQETPSAEAPAEAAEASAAEPAPAPGGKKSPKFYVPSARLAGLPEWFTARDADGDGQLSLAEYAPNAAKHDVDLFSRYDRNGDGLLTAEECTRGAR